MKRKIFTLLTLLYIVLPLVAVQTAFADSIYFTSSPQFDVTAGQLYTYHITVNDTTGSSYTFSFPNLPSWLSFSSATNTISGSTQVAGRYQVNITATDSQGASEQQNYFLYVQAPPTQTQQPVTTPSATITGIPTATPTPTPLPKATATPTPTSSVAQTPIELSTDQIILQDVSPADGSTITTNSPHIRGDIESAFALSKQNFSIFMDANDVSANAQLVTHQKTAQDFSNLFSYIADHLSNGRHTINLTITTPDGITIPKSWSFTVQQPAASPLSTLGSKLSKINFLPIILLILLLLFIIIIVKLIRKSPADQPASEEQQTPETGQSR